MNETETVYGLIYCATNKVNNKRYVGKTTKSFEERKKEHLKQTKYKKYHFYRSIKKYGEESFTWEILQDNIPNFLLDTCETYWIDYFDTFYRGYNSTTGGEGGLVSEETKKKISEAQTGQKNHMFGKKNIFLSRTGIEHHRYGKASPMKGRKHSEKTKKIMSESNIRFWYGKTFSFEHKNKLSIKKQKAIICIENNTIYKSIKEASDKLNLKHSSISRVCLGKRKTTGGYHFAFYTQPQEQSS